MIRLYFDATTPCPNLIIKHACLLTPYFFKRDNENKPIYPLPTPFFPPSAAQLLLQDGITKSPTRHYSCLPPTCVKSSWGRHAVARRSAKAHHISFVTGKVGGCGAGPDRLRRVYRGKGRVTRNRCDRGDTGSCICGR